MPETTETGFQIPTVAELIARIEQDFAARMGNDDVRIPLSFTWAAVRILAGLAYVLYRYGAHTAAQAIYDRAFGPVLRRWARMWGVEPLTATAAVIEYEFVGTAGSGPIPLGTTIQRVDGIEYVTDGASVEAPAGIFRSTATCRTIGEIGNAALGTFLDLVNPIAGISSGYVIDLLGDGPPVTGRDDETDVRLLERLLERIQNPPQGGADADYVLWAREIADVDDVYVYPLELGAGTVTIRFTVLEGKGIGASLRIPDAPKIAEVEAHFAIERPVTADLTVLAPSEYAVDFTIDLFPAPNTAAMRDAVEAQIAALLKRESVPAAAGATDTIDNSKFRTAIGNAEGEDHHDLTSIDGDGTGTSDVVTTTGQLAVLGTITWL